MKHLKKFMALFLVLCLCFGVAGCKKNKKPTGSGTQSNGGGYSSNTEEDYNDTSSDWENQQSDQDRNEGFDNSGEGDTTLTPDITPGQDSGDIVVDLNKPVDTNPANRKFEKSVLSNPDDLQFYYEGSCYAYGITQDNEEVIAFKSVAGELLDVIAGAGKFVLNTSGSVLLVSQDGVASFKQTMKDGYDALVVSYNITGTTVSGSDVETTYIFKENAISVSAQVNADTGKYTISAKTTRFARAFLTDYIDEEVKVNSEWIYPSNGDYPYPEFESVCYKTQITDDVYLYSFQRGENLKKTYGVSNMNSYEMTLTLNDSKGLFYTHEYDLTFVDTLYENKQSADYRGYFKALNSDFAAGIAPIKATDDDSTLYIGNSVDLNINVTNLIDEDVVFSLRYDVRDYYGNIVDKGVFVNSAVFQYTSANRTIHVSGNYGMYYLNLYVISKYSSYMECYPFALLEDYEYKYNATSPWGINSANTKNDTEVINTVKLFTKIGVANSRSGDWDSLGPNMRLMTEEAKKYGITQWNTLTNKNFDEKGIKDYVAEVLKTASEATNYATAIEVGNEANLETIDGSVSVYDRYVQFYNCMFEPTYYTLKEKYPNLKYIASPFSAGQQEWIERLTLGHDVDTDGDGVMDKHIDGIWPLLDIISTHVYSPAVIPDEYSQAKPKYKGGTWCIEGALQRIDESLTLFCNDKTEKDFYITEIGYATPPLSTNTTGLRAQADYNVRAGLLSAAYGADRIQYYCFYDRTRAGCGFDNTFDEWNFGAFYEADYYGRFMPKPWAIAYANMTRVLESIEKNSMHIYEKYDEGYTTGGVRAFKCKTALHGDVIAAYSNFEVLSNGKKSTTGKISDRTPNLPWNNEWKKVDETVFEAKGDKVTVIDIMGNKTEYKAKNGKVTIPLTGSPVYILGAK